MKILFWGDFYPKRLPAGARGFFTWHIHDAGF
jgi:hypothetical protein